MSFHLFFFFYFYHMLNLDLIILERAFYYFTIYFLNTVVNLDLIENRLVEFLCNFIFAVVNIYSIVLEQRWSHGKSWPNDFDRKVNIGEDVRRVCSRYQATWLQSDFDHEYRYKIKLYSNDATVLGIWKDYRICFALLLCKIQLISLCFPPHLF